MTSFDLFLLRKQKTWVEEEIKINTYKIEKAHRELIDLELQIKKGEKEHGIETPKRKG